ncbi:MAG: carbohydrate binding family 9 domain-containing protein, partial [Acidobacteriota bacterium]|nr:carbohydrate binding family 9 domain-containing protein [Acidobacteriota bacterium]
SGIRLPPEKAAPVRIPKLDKPPVIDGKLDDEAWKQAVVLKDFYQTSPGDNIAPSKPTEVLVGYDSKFLYLGFHCLDDLDKVRATVVKRDDVLNGEDSVRVLLDTFNDQRKAYVLAFNPLGIQQDGIRTEGMGVDFSVDIVMESKGSVTNDGWVVEVAIPFKSLRYEAGKGKLWGIQVFRIIQRFNGEQDSWMPISRDVSGLLNQEGHITGLEGISTERTLELIPSLT